MTQTAEQTNLFMGVDLKKKQTLVFICAQQVPPRGVSDKGDWDAPFPGRQILRNPVKVFDEDKQEERWARLLNNASSIWMDEQISDNKLDPKIQAASMIRPELVNGMLFVELPRDAKLAKWLLVHDDRDKGPGAIRYTTKRPVFRLESQNVDGSSEVDRMIMEGKAMGEAYKMPEEDMLQHMIFLNLKDTDQYGRKLEPEAIKAAYMKYAKTNPKIFLESVDSPRMKLYAHIAKLLQSGDISFGDVKDTATWSATKTPILSFDKKSNENKVSQMVNYALSEAGADFLKALDKRLPKK